MVLSFISKSFLKKRDYVEFDLFKLVLIDVYLPLDTLAVNYLESIIIKPHES